MKKFPLNSLCPFLFLDIYSQGKVITLKEVAQTFSSTTPQIDTPTPFTNIESKKIKEIKYKISKAIMKQQ